MSKLNDNFRNANSIYKFKNLLTNLIKVKENPIFAISDPLCLKFLKFPWLKFSYLNEHKCRNNFRDTANTTTLTLPKCCSCPIEFYY